MSLHRLCRKCWASDSVRVRQYWGLLRGGGPLHDGHAAWLPKLPIVSLMMSRINKRWREEGKYPRHWIIIKRSTDGSLSITSYASS